MPKTKSFVTHLMDNVIERGSMTQSDYEIQIQLSILEKLDKKMKEKARFAIATRAYRKLMVKPSFATASPSLPGFHANLREKHNQIDTNNASYSDR